MTIHLPEKEPSLLSVTAEKLSDEIKVCMGGRVAEEIIFGKGSAGAISDLQRSTKLAKAMVTEYGFSENLGPVVYGDENGEPFVGMSYGQGKGYSERVQSEIDAEVRSIIDSSYEAANTILKEHLDKLHLVAKALLVHEKLDNEEFEKIMRGETSPEQIEAEYAEFMGEKSDDKADDTAENSAEENKTDAPAEDTVSEDAPAENTAEDNSDTDTQE